MIRCVSTCEHRQRLLSSLMQNFFPSVRSFFLPFSAFVVHSTFSQDFLLLSFTVPFAHASLWFWHSHTDDVHVELYFCPHCWWVFCHNHFDFFVVFLWIFVFSFLCLLPFYSLESLRKLCTFFVFVCVSVLRVCFRSLFFSYAPHKVHMFSQHGDQNSKIMTITLHIHKRKRECGAKKKVTRNMLERNYKENVPSAFSNFSSKCFFAPTIGNSKKNDVLTLCSLAVCSTQILETLRFKKPME